MTTQEKTGLKVALALLAAAVVILIGTLLLCATATAHPLDLEECGWFARDVYLDAMDRDQGKTLAQQTAEFQLTRCAQGACVYRDAEDIQRLTDALTAMYGPDKKTYPAALADRAALKCEKAAREEEHMDELRHLHGSRP